MKRLLLISCLVIVGWLVAGADTAGAQGRVSPMAMNAKVLSLEVQSRIMVIRKPDGSSQRVMLDDVVGGFGDIRSGDNVLLTLRDEPAIPRVTSLIKSAPSVATVAASRPGVAAVIEPGSDAELDTATPLEPLEDGVSMRGLFSQQVAVLASRANAVDLLWGQFRSSCDVKTSSRYDEAREWFGLWDGRVRADLSSGFCRDLFNSIVDAGASINAGMEGAEEAADDYLYPGTMREIKRRYAMDWDGWSMSRPAPLQR